MVCGNADILADTNFIKVFREPDVTVVAITRVVFLEIKDEDDKVVAEKVIDVVCLIWIEIKIEVESWIRKIGLEIRSSKIKIATNSLQTEDD